MVSRRTIGVLALSIAGVTSFHTSLFHDRINHRSIATTSRRIRNPKECSVPTSTTKLNMFMGSDGGLLGVGGPEVVTILLVGYFVLGPSELYKLVKEIGKFIQNLRTLGSDLSTTFESNMESTLQLEELRKAQRELNDAFSFRRSINTEEEAGAFSVTAGSAQIAEAKREEEMAAQQLETTAGVSTTQKKIRRRVKRRKAEPPPAIESEPALATSARITTNNPGPALVNNIPDLVMPHSETSDEETPEELALIESEFAKYTATPYSDAQSRFQQQISGRWNDEIVKNTASLEPMGALMEQVALLEQERKAALERLEDEFARRKEIETEFYRKRRSAIEEKITETQVKAFGVSSKPL